MNHTARGKYNSKYIFSTIFNKRDICFFQVQVQAHARDDRVSNIVARVREHVDTLGARNDRVELLPGEHRRVAHALSDCDRVYDLRVHLHHKGNTEQGKHHKETSSRNIGNTSCKRKLVRKCCKHCN